MGTPRTSILFLSADPTDASRLRLGQELRDIQMRLRLANAGENFDLHHRTSLRPGDLTQAIFDTKPAIIHFSGHGSPTGQLLLENDAGRIHPVEPEALESLFALFRNDVRCVILNSCYSYKQAIAISKHIENVIGMTKAIGDEAAIAFSVGFYKALGARRPVHECFEFGRIELRLHNIPEYHTPIFLRHPKVSHMYLEEKDYIFEHEGGGKLIMFPPEHTLLAKLVLENGRKSGCILIDPEAYDCIGALLDDIYVNYLQGELPILSYGDSWVISIKYGSWGTLEQLAVPWQWVLGDDRNKYHSQWLSLRKLPPGDFRLGRGSHGRILMSPKELSRENYAVLAVNDPLIYDIAGSGPKAMMAVCSKMTKVPIGKFEEGRYHYKAVIHRVGMLYSVGVAGFALVDTKLSRSQRAMLKDFFLRKDFE